MLKAKILDPLSKIGTLPYISFVVFSNALYSVAG
jgi:hypothetical protein